MKYSEVLARLQNLIGLIPSQSQLCDITGVKQSAMSNRAKENSAFKQSDIQKLNDFYGINLYTNTLENNHKNIKNDVCVTPQSDKVLIDYYPDVLVSCGNGIYSLGETKEQMTVPKKLIKGYSDSYKYVIVTAFSDSMQPEIKEKDMLIVRVAEMENIIDNHIYIFCHEGRFYCKYLSYNLGQVIVRSLNPEYPTRYIEKENLENFELIGEVCGIFRNVV